MIPRTNGMPGAQIVALIHLRSEVLGDPDAKPEDQIESVKAIDKQIRDAIGHAADEAGVAIRRFESLAEADRKEAKYYHARAAAYDSTVEWLKEQVIGVMNFAGTKSVEGPHATLSIKKNPASLDVAQPELVPPNYQRRHVTLTTALWERLLAHLMTTDKGGLIFADLVDCKISEPEPMKDAIKAELKAGIGVPGCRIVDDRVRLVVE